MPSEPGPGVLGRRGPAELDEPEVDVSTTDNEACGAQSFAGHESSSSSGVCEKAVDISTSSVGGFGGSLSGKLPRQRRWQIQSLCFQCFSFACFAISNMLLPIFLLVQMIGLDLVVWNSESSKHTLIFFVPMELALAVHMVRHAQSQQAVRAGSLQWIVYSWLISAKSIILYFWVLRESSVTSSTLDEISRFLYVTPVFYCILTFRTLRQLFSGKENFRGSFANSARRDRQEYMTLDVVLLQDMVWHVVIDLIDINYMMFLTNPVLESSSSSSSSSTEGSSSSSSSSSSDSSSSDSYNLVTDFSNDFAKIRVAVGSFIALALFFHQQSFPSCSVVSLAEKETRELAAAAAESRGSASRRRSSSSSSSGGNSEEMTNAERFVGQMMTNQSTWAANGRSGQRRHKRRSASERMEQIADVVKARKRSAIVSIILVDLPFCVIRTYLWSGSMAGKSYTSQSTSSFAGFFSVTSSTDDYSSRPMLDKWLVKNFLCLLLQAMQLRFVQQADLERSQSLRWWEHGGRSSDLSVGRSKARRTVQDPHMQQLWRSIDRSKLEAAYEAAGGGSSGDEVNASLLEDSPGDDVHFPASPEGTAASRRQTGGLLTSRLSSARAHASSSLSSAGMLSSTSHRSSRASEWERWELGCCCFSCYCCCRRRRRSRSRRCRCCSCDCSHSVFLHAVMGLALGWLIAKVDFAQAFTDLVYGLGYQTAS